MRRWVTVLTLVLTVAGAPFGLSSPLTISYQGQITDANGLPINGPVNLGIGVFTSPSGGSASYTETQNQVPVSNGSFTVTLGTGTNANGTNRTGDLFQALTGGTDLWIELTVNGEIQAPRQRLVSVPFSLTATNSDTLGGLNAAAVVASAKGPPGDKGPTGAPGAPGPVTTTSAVCTEWNEDLGTGVTCHQPPDCTCGSSQPLVRISGSCQVVASNGTCSADVCTDGNSVLARGTCCICRN